MNQTGWTNHSNIGTLFQAEQNLRNERRFEAVSMFFMAVVFGIILGYGWHMWHVRPMPTSTEQTFKPIDWAELYEPCDKKRNRGLMPKIR